MGSGDVFSSTSRAGSRNFRVVILSICPYGKVKEMAGKVSVVCSCPISWREVNNE